MLTIPTPTTVRTVPAETTNERHYRKPGAVGLLLDPTVILGYVHSQLTEHECESPDDLSQCSSVRVEPLLLLQSPIGELAIIGSEGVGDAVEEELGKVPAYVAIGWSYQRVELPHDVIQQAITGEGADVAGHIRLFGDRLDTNAYLWRRFVGID